MQFYILMVDYPRRVFEDHIFPAGREAIVNPELTRRDIVDQARDIISEGRNSIAFVKQVDGNFICDVTQEIVAEASQMVEAA
jgi:hypothetical protein